MSLSNNDMILKDVMDSIKRSGEQLEAEKTITWEDLGDIQAKLVKILSERLKTGAEKYHQELPIFTIEDNDRDNLFECEQEILDALNYSSAGRMKAAEFVDKHKQNAYRIQMTRVIAHLCYAFFNLKKAQNTENNININNKNPEGGI